MRSEEDKARRKKALKILFSSSTDEMDCSVGSSNRTTSESHTLIFGNNSFVSFVRGMDRSFNDRNTAAHSTPVNSKGNKIPCLGSPYLESLNLSDTDFFDSETGKQMILDDQASHERFAMQPTDCTGCSSWTPFSRKNVSSMSIPLSGFKQKESISVGELIGRFSETVSFSDVHKNQNIFANCFTSTPKEKRKSRSMSSLLDKESKDFSSTTFSSLDHRRDEPLGVIGTPTSIKPLNISIPRCIEKSQNTQNFHYFIGSTNRKHIDRMRKEERKTRGLDETFSFDSMQTVAETKASGANGSETNTFATTATTFALTTTNISKSCNNLWFLDPETVLMDTNKGNRVKLINNSTKNLRFKTEFDSRIINICPLSGTVPAMSQIGLRLLVSKYAKKQIENFDIKNCDIKVIIGKNEKKIQVKFVKTEKSKSSKDRSYILY